MSRVRIGVCHGAADAALVRSVFDAHEIAVVIGAENHANLLGGLGDGFLTLDISVDESYAEEAAELLREIRSEPVTTESYEANEPDQDEAVWVEQRVDRRRKTGVVLLLAFCITFGTAHMYTRAWLRGIALAGLEVIGIRYLGAKPVIGGLLIAAAVVTDLVGALLRVRSPATALPAARAQRRRA
ncbi:MAG TPA: hypothetical protein VIU61_20725 [Kofleriaceae bacterium]